MNLDQQTEQSAERVHTPGQPDSVHLGSAVPSEDLQTARPAWIALTDEDRQRAFESLPFMLDGFLKTWGWLHFANAIEAICREKNIPNAALLASHKRLQEALRDAESFVMGAPPHYAKDRNEAVEIVLPRIRAALAAIPKEAE